MTIKYKGEIETTQEIVLKEVAAKPSAPASGKGLFYKKDNGLWYVQDSAGKEELVLIGDKTANNIMLNAFRIAVNGGLSRLNMQDGIVDEFEDETGIDTASSTNEDYDASNNLYSPTGTTVLATDHNKTPNSEEGGLANASLRAVIDADDLVTGGNIIRITVHSHTTEALTVDNVSIVERSGSGANGTTTPTEIFFSGSSGFAIAANSTLVSDNLHFTIDPAKDYLVIFDINASTSNDGVRRWNDAGALSYWKLTTDSWNQQNVSGFSSVTAVYIAMKLEVLQPDNMTLISNTVTAETADPDEAHLILFEEDVDAVTENTDLKGYASRDGGTTWTQITLTDEGDYGAGQRILSGTGDISGQPSGSSMEFKVETLNNKNLKLRGAALEWR